MPKCSQFLDLGQGISVMLGLPSIPIWDEKTRPKKAKPGTFGFNSKTSSLEYWDGESWFAAELEVSA